MRESSFTNLPLMTFPANGTPGEDVIVSDAQERFEFAVDPDVNVLPGVGADEMQPFHGGLRDRYGSDESGLQPPN